jgi:hypothetical protein
MSRFDGPTHLIIIHQKMIDERNRKADGPFLEKAQAASIYTFKKEYGRGMQVKKLNFTDAKYLFLAPHFAES